jgi:hypothetical protein
MVILVLPVRVQAVDMFHHQLRRVTRRQVVVAMTMVLLRKKLAVSVMEMENAIGVILLD